MAAQDPDQARLRRKLSSSNRLSMARLALERFRRPDLRATETDAREILVATFMAAAAAIPKREIETLKKHGYAQDVSWLDLPSGLYLASPGQRTFKRPDGVEVTRAGAGKAVYVACPSKDERELPSFNSWREAQQSSAARVGGYRDAPLVKLPRAVTIPGTMSVKSHGEAQGDRVAEFEAEGRNRTDPKTDAEAVSHNILRIDGCRSKALVGPEMQAAIQAYFLAADARITAERGLIVSAIKVIATCTTYGQTLDFWPEVQELEDTMFGPTVIPPAMALVLLTDEDKAALCANMASRGVPSASCARLAA